MTKEYNLHSRVYRVERSFIGTKQASELIRQRVIRGSRNTAASASGLAVARLEKAEKIS